MAWVGAVVQGVTGIAQTIAASEAAKKLPEAQQYTPSPQMRRAEEMALRRAEQGMSAAERAAFEQGMARRTGAAERAMRNLGMSGLASGISNIFNIDAMNQFAAQSEGERRRGEQMYAGIAGQMQAIQDRETSSFNQMLQQQRAALGGAAASGMKNITGAFGMAAQAANTNKLAEAYANSGDTYNFGTGTTGATTPATTTAPPPATTVSDISGTGGYGATPGSPAAIGTLEGSGIPFLPADGSMDYRVMDSSDAFYSDTEPRFDSKTSPFGSDVSSEKAFQDYANAQAGYDITKGYGWGPASSAAYGIYGQQFRNR
jgi:hypothetical protein